MLYYRWKKVDYCKPCIDSKEGSLEKNVKGF